MKNLLFFIGIGVVLGAIGSVDIGKLELAQAVKQGLARLAMVAVGVR